MARVKGAWAPYAAVASFNCFISLKLKATSCLSICPGLLGSGTSMTGGTWIQSNHSRFKPLSCELCLSVIAYLLPSWVPRPCFSHGLSGFTETVRGRVTNWINTTHGKAFPSLFKAERVIFSFCDRVHTVAQASMGLPAVLLSQLSVLSYRCEPPHPAPGSWVRQPLLPSLCM